MEGGLKPKPRWSSSNPSLIESSAKAQRPRREAEHLLDTPDTSPDRNHKQALVAVTGLGGLAFLPHPKDFSPCVILGVDVRNAEPYVQIIEQREIQMQANELTTAEWIVEIAASIAKRKARLETLKSSWQRMTLREEIRMREGWLEAMKAEVA